MKKGTTAGTGHMMKSMSKSGVRHGPGNKNVVTRGRRGGKPSAPTGPIKGADKGGV